jgi:hypothetical protein
VTSRKPNPVLDRADAARAELEHESAAGNVEEHRQLTIRLRSGRHALVSLPVDIAPAELFDIVAWLAGDFRLLLEREHTEREMAAAAGFLDTPTGPHLVPHG